MIIGVDLGGTNIRAGTMEDGSITKRVYATLKEKDSLPSTLQQLTDTIKPLVQSGITGIGIAVPSVVDIKNGIVYNVVNIPSWERVELKDILEKAFKLPVRVDNDANCFARGEHVFGKAKSYNSIVGITLGTGVGSGLILENKLYAGSNCGAGEVGYLPYMDRDFEFYCSGDFFGKIHHTSAQDMHQNGILGDASALQLWNEFGHHIGNLVKAVVYAYDPEVIVFGGSVAKAFPLFESAMKQEMTRNFHFPESMKRLKIFQSDNENITLLGAASLITNL